MAWRLAKSLDTLRAQVNAMAPNRSKISDGTVGDAAHASRSSDHNPWVKQGSMGIVTALDLTHDPAHGFNSWDFAEMLRLRRDPRIKYVISKARICSGNVGPSPWVWRKYTGSNSHTHHVHISVVPNASGYDETRAWEIDGDWNKGKDAPSSPPARPLLKQGSRGPDVTILQTLLGLPSPERDSDFGPKTKAAVIAFQKAKGLTADGIVGPYTWEALE